MHGQIINAQQETKTPLPLDRVIRALTPAHDANDGRILVMTGNTQIQPTGSRGSQPPYAGSNTQSSVKTCVLTIYNGVPWATQDYINLHGAIAEHFDRVGVDLRSFPLGSPQLEAILAELDIPRDQIVGFSYGPRVILTYGIKGHKES